MTPFFSKSTLFLNNLNALRGKLRELLEEKYLDKDKKTFPDKDASLFRKIRPHLSVGAGRASGALAFELVTSAKTSSSHIAC